MFQRQREHDGKRQGVVEKTGWGKENKRQIEKGKGMVLSWEDKPPFFISVCKMLSLGYLSLGSLKLFFLIIIFSSSTSSGPCFPYSAQ